MSFPKQAAGATPLTIGQNFSWTAAGSLFYAGCQWGMLVLIARLGTPEMVGQLTLALAVVTPIFFFTNLGLRLVQATDAGSRYHFGEYLALRLLTTAGAFMVAAAIALAVWRFSSTSLAIMAMAAARSMEAISDIIYGLLQKHERMDRIAWSAILKGFLSLLMLGSGVFLTGGILWGILGLAAAWAMTLLVYDAPNALAVLCSGTAGQGKAIALWTMGPLRLPRPLWNRGRLQQLARLSLPLGLATSLNSLGANVPRYFVAYFLDQHSLGIFGALAYSTMPGVLITSSLGQAVVPQLAQQYERRNRKGFRKLLERIVLFGVVLALAGIAAALTVGSCLLAHLYGREYAAYPGVFLCLVAATGINYSGCFFNYSMTAARRLQVQPLIYAGSAALTALLCLLLIPHSGILGASEATLIAALAETAALFFFVLRAIHSLEGTIGFSHQ